MAALTVLLTFPARLLSRPKAKNAPPNTVAPHAKLQPRLWLADWQKVRRVPLGESVHPTAQRLILAALRHEILRIRYLSGSTPGAERVISPTMVFQVGGCGPLYVSGYCHLRGEERVFRVDRLELLGNANDIVCITE